MCTKMKKRIWEHVFAFCIFFGCLALPLHGNPDGPVYVPGGSALSSSQNPDTGLPLPTVTVRGFLNFRTTVDGTVIVFTPASETPQDPTPSFAPSSSSSSSSLPSISKISSRNDDVQHITYKDHNELITTELENEANTGEDRDSFKHLKPGFSGDLTTPENPEIPLQKPNFGVTPALPQYPTGLVTVLGGTHVNDGATTVYETKVIGTYIDGKYAQILQSTSQIIFSASKSDIRLKELTTPKPSPSKPDFQSVKFSTDNSRPSEPLTTPIRQRPTPRTSTTKEYRNPTTTSDRQTAERRKDDGFDINTVLQTSFKLPDIGPNINRISRPTQSLEKSQSRSSYMLTRRFRPTSDIVATDVLDDENTVPEFQNTRRLPPRFRYVLPRRTSPTVRLNRFKVKLTVRNDGGSSDSYVTPQDTTFDPDEELDYDPLQPVDPARVTYEKTTITSEVTLHVGRKKSVRTLTITTSVPRTKHATDIFRHHHDIHPANNNAIFATTYLDGEEPQNVVTRTYTTTERMLKTSVVPFLDGNSTSYHTVTESFFILKLITGYKTLPPSDVTLITNDPTAADIESGMTDMPDSETIDGLLDGAIPLDPVPAYHQVLQTPVPNGLLQVSGSGREHAVVPLVGSRKSAKQLELSNSLMSLGAALQQNPLAAVYLGLQQLNRQATLYSTITKASTYIATDTIYSTKVVSIYDGRRTRTRTLSESLSTTERTMTTYTTTVTPYLNTQLFPQQNQLQQLLGTQINGGGMALPPPPPQYSTVTSTITTVTTATNLSTRIYTLIYNALSTKFRTVTSTSLYETTVTITSTSEVPIAITAPPGGVFPFLG